MFILQITLDRHNAILKLNYCPLPDPPNFCYHLPLRGLTVYWLVLKDPKIISLIHCVYVS